MVKRYADGSQMVIAVLDSGQYFGEIGLLQDVPRGASIRVPADDQAALVTLDKATFLRLIQESSVTSEVVARLNAKYKAEGGHSSIE